LFITAEDDNTFAVTRLDFELNQNNNSLIITYKGNSHGFPLLEQDPLLDDVIVAR